MSKNWIEVHDLYSNFSQRTKNIWLIEKIFDQIYSEKNEAVNRFFTSLMKQII